MKHLYGITEYDILHSSSNPGYHPDVFQAALILLEQLQVAEASGAETFVFPCLFRNGNLGQEPWQSFCEMVFLDYLCDISLKYVYFCPGLLYVPCVFWHHRHGDLTWLVQPFFFCNVSCSTWLLCNNFPTCCATQAWLDFHLREIARLVVRPSTAFSAKSQRASCALELSGPSRRQFPGKKNMLKVRESFRNTGSRNYIFNFMEFKYQFFVFGDP